MTAAPLTLALPVPVDDEDEPVILALEHRGRRVMSHVVRMGGQGRAIIRSVQAMAVYDGDGGPRTLSAQLRSTVEDIASGIAGDGTDAQRLALADWIREGWQHRLSGADLRREASTLDDAAREALERFHGVVADGGYIAPNPTRWAQAVTEATAEVQARFGGGFDVGDPAPLTNDPSRGRVVPSDYIPVRADDVLGLAARIADLEHDLARAQQRIVEELARADERQREIETILAEAQTSTTLAGLTAEARIRSAPDPAPIPHTPQLSELPCSRCGVHHQVDLFEPGQRVGIIHVEGDDPGRLRVRPPIGAVGYVIEWRSMNGPVWVRVQFDGDVRENFDPCQLEPVT